MKTMLPVAFICDRGYVMQTAVAITSLIRSKYESTALDIAVISHGLAEEEAQPLLRLSRPDAEVRVVSGDACFTEDSFLLSDSRYRVATKAALLKFYLPGLLPELERVLYLDGDILVRRDLSELAKLELGDRLAAVVRDLPQVFYERQLLGESRDYFNSGVMLLNLAQMRRENLTERLVEAKKAYTDDQLMDQSVFNRVMAGRVHQLSPVYNVCYANLRRRWRRERMLDKINAASGTAFTGLEDLRRSAAILHFSSREKPWRYDDIPAGEEWLACYRLTEFGGRELERTSWRTIERRERRLRLINRARRILGLEPVSHKQR